MQLSLFCDYRFHLKTSTFYVKYDALFLAVEAAWEKNPRNKRPGRTGYGELSFLKALIYKHAQSIKSIPELLRDLESRPVLCEMIGFTPVNSQTHRVFTPISLRTTTQNSKTFITPP